MSTLDKQQQSALQQAQERLRRGDTKGALAAAQALVAEAPGAPDALQILGICLVESGQHALAVKAFQDALKLAPGHPLLLTNLARVHTQRGHPAEAIKTLRQAVTTNPTFAPAWLALGNQLIANSELHEAARVLEKVTRLSPQQTAGWIMLAKAQRARGDLQSAQAALNKAIELEPSNARAWLNLGAVHRLLGRPREALHCYSKAQQLGYQSPDLADARIGALLDLGQSSTAMSEATELVRRHPTFADGQRTLAHLLWEHGSALAPDQDPFAAFSAAVDQYGDRSLRLAYAQFLLSAQKADIAIEQLKLIRAEADHPMLQALTADCHELLDEPEAAGRLYQDAYAELSHDPNFLCSYARHLLKAGDWHKARDTAAHAVNLSPEHQEAWAYLSTAWRLLGDEREFWLCDYDNAVAFLAVEAPQSFNNISQFTEALEQTLTPMHQAKREPVHQSVRGGSQTPGRLFGRDNKVLQDLQSSLTQTIRSWLKGLKKEQDHPFYRHVGSDIFYSGSWSVRLWSSGKHANHIHPEGWISSAYYISLPPAVVAAQRGGADHSGAIQFGQPPAELALDLAPRRIIRPKVGHLALFPSFMWHGTVPFTDEQPRMTVAFDIQPLATSINSSA